MENLQASLVIRLSDERAKPGLQLLECLKDLVEELALSLANKKRSLRMAEQY